MRIGDVVEQRTEAAFDAAETTADYDAAAHDLLSVFDAVIAHEDARRPGALVDAAFAFRVASQLALADGDDAAIVLPYLRENDAFARALAFAAKPGLEDMKNVYALARRMIEERGEHLNDYPFLAAAMCVVHDQPLRRNYNENRAESPDPIALFDFYLAHEKQQFFGLTSMPAELMVYVVDVTATLDDLRWAVQRFAGDAAVGRRFFDIQYDYDHYRTGAPKKCTLAGWGLANIAQHGGVCADQAYFAVTVGKAIGVPTAYTVGKSADVGHAWVGYLAAQGRNSVWWNFNEGRYGAYQGLKGVVYDPQIRRAVPDSMVSLLADFGMSKTDERYAAAALGDAAARLGQLRETGAADWNPPALIETARSRRGQILNALQVDTQLRFLEASVRAAPGYAPAWYMIAALASEGHLTLADKKEWAEILSRLAGRKYPDFTLTILKPMVESVDDVEDQNGFWNAAFRQFQGRHDLCAEIRMEQAAMWQAAGEINKAGQCYMDVIQRFANAGPFVVEALARAEQLLRDSDRAAEIVRLYAQTWQSIRRPEEMAGQFAVQSNWYRVGMAYAEKLEEAGMGSDANFVRQTVRGG